MKLPILLLLTLASATRGTSTSEASAPSSTSGKTPAIIPTELQLCSYCGKNSECTVVGGRPLCWCPPGTTGDPKKECVDMILEASATRGTSTSETSAPASTSGERPAIIPRPLPTKLRLCQRCGKNSECTVVGGKPICKCPPGTTGNPQEECVDMVGRVTSSSNAPTNFFESGYFPLSRLYHIHPNHHGTTLPFHGPVYFTSSLSHPSFTFIPGNTFLMVNSPQESSNVDTQIVLQFQSQAQPLKKLMYKLSPSLDTESSDASSLTHNNQKLIAPTTIINPSVPVVPSLNFAYNFQAQYQ